MIAVIRSSPGGPSAAQVEEQVITRAVALAALTGIAAIHALQAPEAFRDAGYLGALFIAAVVASLVLAAVLAHSGDPRVLDAAGMLAGVILLGYVLSRTTGLPGFTDDIGEWAEPLGLLSMVAEGLLLCLVTMRRRT